MSEEIDSQGTHEIQKRRSSLLESLDLNFASFTAQSEVQLESFKSLVAPEPEAADHRHGTLWTASGHILTAIIGAGVLGLPNAISWLGWVAGPLCLTLFYLVTLLTSTLLANCHEIKGVRFRRYPKAVLATLGKRSALALLVFQVLDLSLTSVAYQIAGAQSIEASVKTLLCGKDVDTQPSSCTTGIWPEVLYMGAIQLVFSQLPDLDSAWWASAIGAIMSIAYSAIALGLTASHAGDGHGNLGGTPSSTPNKVFQVFNALGTVAFAYKFSSVLMEINDTIKEPPPARKTMRKAVGLSLFTSYFFYLCVGVFGYLAYGTMLSGYGDILTVPNIGPKWVIVMANVMVWIHMIPAYQVMSQPLFDKGERALRGNFPNSVAKIRPLFLRLVFRSTYVGLTTLIACILPFFSVIVGLIGALVFWPVAVYFPIRMYRSVYKVGKKLNCCLYAVDTLMLLVAICAVIGSLRNLIVSASSFQIF